MLTRWTRHTIAGLATVCLAAALLGIAASARSHDDDGRGAAFGPSPPRICAYPARASDKADTNLANTAVTTALTQALVAHLKSAPATIVVPLAWPAEDEDAEPPSIETLAGIGRLEACSGVVITQLREIVFEEEERDRLFFGIARSARAGLLVTGGLVDVATGRAVAPIEATADVSDRAYRGPSPADIEEAKDPEIVERSLVGRAIGEAREAWLSAVMAGLPALSPGEVRPPQRADAPPGVGFVEAEYPMAVTEGFDRRGVVSVVNRGREARSIVIRPMDDPSGVAIGLKGDGADRPALVAPGRWKVVRVVVNSSEAEGARDVRLGLFSAPGGEDPDLDAQPSDVAMLRLRIEPAPADVVLEILNQDPRTLAYRARLTNRSSSDTDVEVVPAGEDADRIRTSPNLSDVHLKAGSTRDFSIVPRLVQLGRQTEARVIVRAGRQETTRSLRFDIPSGQRVFLGLTSTTETQGAASGACTNEGKVYVAFNPFPDVAAVPTAPGAPVPVPYPNIAAPTGTSGSRRIRMGSPREGPWLKGLLGDGPESSPHVRGTFTNNARAASLRPAVAEALPVLATDNRDQPLFDLTDAWAATVAYYPDDDGAAVSVEAWRRDAGLARPTVRLNTPGHAAYWPDLRLRPSDARAFVVWEDTNGRAADVAFRASGPGVDGWRPIQYLTNHGRGVHDPVVRVASDRVVVAWEDRRDGTGRIALRESRDGGASFGPEVLLPRAAGEDHAWPQVALLEGGIALVYVSRTDAAATVMARRLGADLQPTGTPAILSNAKAPAGEPQVAADASGRVYAVWREGEDRSSEIWASASDDGRWTVPTRLTADDGFSEYPLIEAVAGQLWVTFLSDVTSGVALRYAVESLDAGATWSAPRALPAVRDPVARAWVEARFALQWPRADYQPHDTRILVNGTLVGELRDMVPDGAYVFEIPPGVLQAGSTELGPNVVLVETANMNDADYVELQEVRLHVKRAFTQVPVVAASQADADTAAAGVGGHLNHDRPNLVVAARPDVDLPVEFEEGDEVEIPVRVFNLGEAVAGGAVAAIRAWRGGEGAEDVARAGLAPLAEVAIDDLAPGAFRDLLLRFAFDAERTTRVRVVAGDRSALVDALLEGLDLGLSAGQSSDPPPLFGTDIPDLFRAPALLDFIESGRLERLQQFLRLPGLERWADLSAWRSPLVGRLEDAINERRARLGLRSIDLRRWLRREEPRAPHLFPGTKSPQQRGDDRQH